MDAEFPWSDIFCMGAILVLGVILIVQNWPHRWGGRWHGQGWMGANTFASFLNDLFVIGPAFGFWERLPTKTNRKKWFKNEKGNEGMHFTHSARREAGEVDASWQGEWDDDGNEWLEHPEGSGNYFYRDQSTGQWVKHE